MEITFYVRPGEDTNTVVMRVTELRAREKPRHDFIVQEYKSVDKAHAKAAKLSKLAELLAVELPMRYTRQILGTSHFK